MFASNLPGPVLSLALDPLARIQQSDGVAVGGLWSVLTKVRDAVVEGRRLENLTWRLWYKTRAAPSCLAFKSELSTLPTSADIPSRTPFLSTPSLSLSFSSDDTNTSSDWDRETAVGEADGNGSMCRISQNILENSVVFPHLDHSHPNSDASNLIFHSTSSQCLQGKAMWGQSDRPLPLASPSQGLPHDHALHTTTSAQGTSLLPLEDQPLDPAQTPSGPPLPVISPHEPMSPVTYPREDDASLHTGPGSHLLVTSPQSSTTSASVPIADSTMSLSTKCASVSLPKPLLALRENNSTIDRLVARLFTDATISVRDTHAAQRSGSSGKQHLALDQGKPILAVPKVVEPPSLPSVVPSSPALTIPAPVSAMSTPRQPCPTVVVVNPTPNPTPHPTPPATPSPEESDTQANSVAISRCTRLPEAGRGGGSGSANGQLSTPDSIHGDATTNGSVIDPRLEQQLLGPLGHSNSEKSNRFDPTGMIVLSERSADYNVGGRLLTPDAELASPSEMAHRGDTKSITVPIPTSVVAPTEDKKFFLAAPHSGGSGGSGHDSTESPDSLGQGSSISPLKHGVVVNGQSLLNPREQRNDAKGEEHHVSGSLSASSPCAPSITSSKGGSSRHKGRAPAFSAASGGNKRKTGKRLVLSPKSTHAVHRKDVEILTTAASEKSRNRSVETDKGSSSTKGKEREVGERPRDDDVAALDGNVPCAKTSPHVPLPPKQHPAHHLRHLPTNPSRRQQPPGQRTTTESTERKVNNAQVKPESRQQMPYDPQLPLALGHLPSAPGRARRPIEITETSSDYTTDTDGDDSSWESESISEGAGQDTATATTQPGVLRATNQKESGPSTKHEKKAATATTSSNQNRTRDPGEFVRDAALEAQRQKDMFQKLPELSYSNSAKLPRTKSGLSLLFRPDPELFPENHPYRTTRSTQDLLARNWSTTTTMPAPPPLAMAALTKRASAAGPMEATVNASSSVTKSTRPATPDMTANGRRRSGYRRLKPADEVEESDSGDDDPNDSIQVSSSIAERRLAALIGGQGRKKSSLSSSQPQPPRNPPPPAITSDTQDAQPVQPVQSGDNAPSQQPLTRTATMPVSMLQLMPVPAPLQTPHTIRRNIISQELDEELRRNLLWERSQNQVQGRPPRAPGSILPGPWRGLQQFTPVRPADRQSESGAANNTGSEGNAGANNRCFATQRTKSWAGDYHASGW